MTRILTLFDSRVAIFAAGGLLLSWLVSSTLSTRFGRSRTLVIFALISILLVLSVTVVNRGVVRSNEGWRHDLTWWTRNWSATADAIRSDVGWWLNIVLYVPAGLAWSKLTHRRGVVWVTLLAASFVTESAQAAVLGGAADPADLLANAIGAGLGCCLVDRTTPSELAQAARRCRFS